MEVHHSHHPTHKRSWKEYITEFLMLFAAVSLGFLAENLREIYIEREREHELAESLYNEMRADSIDLEKVMAFRIKKEAYLDFLYQHFQGDVDEDTLQKKFQVAEYIGVGANSATIFEPRNAIIHQLISSGMMRYFKNPAIQSDLHDIINNAEKVRIRMQREWEIYENQIMPLSVKYRNTDFQRDIIGIEEPKAGVTSLMEKYLNDTVYYKYDKREIRVEDLKTMRRSYEIYRFVLMATRKAQLSEYKKINAKLLADLKRAYHL